MDADRCVLTVVFVSSIACSKNEGEGCGDEPTSKYSSSTKVPNRNRAGSGEFLLTVYNPASSHGKKISSNMSLTFSILILVGQPHEAESTKLQR